MVCSKCGSEINVGEKFCQNCGEKVDYVKQENISYNQVGYYSEKTNEAVKNYSNYVGTPIYVVLKYIASAISFIGFFGIMVSDIGDYAVKNSYGGDAYTGIQQAGATTANNIRMMASMCKIGFACFLLAFGFLMLSMALKEKDRLINN